MENGGIRTSPHNEKPNKVAAAEGGGHLVGWAAEGRPSLCGDVWIPPFSTVGKYFPTMENYVPTVGNYFSTVGHDFPTMSHTLNRTPSSTSRVTAHVEARSKGG